ncbi:MAG: serine/threonine protein kinase [Myxococcales bacterium]|nr:serine/threonine protein kinase [Myxococcales bacterium]
MSEATRPVAARGRGQTPAPTVEVQPQGLAPGDVLDRRYRILGRLGQGGMGTIYLAEHLQFQRQVAIKVLPPPDPGARDESGAVAHERFLVEARAVCHLQHNNLVTYHDFGVELDTGRLYLVLELLKGKDLSRVLAKEQPIPLSRTVHILGQLCDALTEAHRGGVVHRDLKPANIMLVRRGDDPDFVKLIDFGIARADHVGDGGSLTGEHKLIGTTGYLAPEYIARQEVSPKVDLYAVGVIAYELIAGHRPFRDKDPQRVMVAHLTLAPEPLDHLQDGRVVPPALSRVIMKALAKDPRERWDSASQLRQHLLAAARPLLEKDVSEPTRSSNFEGISSTTAIEFAPQASAWEETDAETPTPAAGPPGRSDSAERQTSPASTRRQRALGSLALDEVSASRTFSRGASRRSWAPWLVLGGAAVVAAAAFAMTRAPSPEPARSPTVAAVDVERRSTETESARARHGLQVAGGGPDAEDSRERRKIELYEAAPAIRPARAVGARPTPKPLPAPVATAPTPAADTLVSVVVTVKPFGEMSLEGRSLGKNRATVSLRPGRHCFRVSNPSREQTWCRMVSAETRSIQFDLAPPVDSQTP